MNPGDFRLTSAAAVDTWRRILSRALGRPLHDAPRGGQNTLRADGAPIDTPEARAFWAACGGAP